MSSGRAITNEQAAEYIARGLIGAGVGAASIGSTEFMRGGSLVHGVKVGSVVGAALGVLSGIVRDPGLKLAALSALMAATAVVGIKKVIKSPRKRAKTIQVTVTPTSGDVPVTKDASTDA